MAQRGTARTRVYFNRFRDWPLVWSFDDGDQQNEMNVRAFELHGVNGVSATDMTVPAGDEMRPRTWIELLGVVWFEVRDEVVHFYG
jgi:hypothetical protein